MLQKATRRTLGIADQAGLQALLTHPIDEEASRFYRRLGFGSSPIGEQQLLPLLKDARKLLSQVAASPSPGRKRARQRLPTLRPALSGFDTNSAWHSVSSTRFHPARRDRPDGSFKIDLGPGGTTNLTVARSGQNRKLRGLGRQVPLFPVKSGEEGARGADGQCRLMPPARHLCRCRQRMLKVASPLRRVFAVTQAMRLGPAQRQLELIPNPVCGFIRICIQSYETEVLRWARCGQIHIDFVASCGTTRDSSSRDVHSANNFNGLASREAGPFACQAGLPVKVVGRCHFP